MSAIEKPSVRAVRGGLANVADERVGRAVHRAEQGGAALDAAVHLALEYEPGKRVAVIEAVVVADDRGVDGAGHRHDAAARAYRVERFEITKRRGSLNSNVP